jgi:hypothetical protein
MATSRMFESYSADIEALLGDGVLRQSLQLALALPAICTALEDAELASSEQKYLAWCEAWLQNPRPVDPRVAKRNRLYRTYLRSLGLQPTPASAAQAPTLSLRTLRMRRRARANRTLERPPMWMPVNRLQAFRVRLIESLVKAARRWYSESANTNVRVQQNLARLALSG